LTIAIDDDKCSAASGQSAQALLPALFFDSVTAKSAVEIGEAAGTGDYPKFDKSYLESLDYLYGPIFINFKYRIAYFNSF
jgi:hypothetical protein